MPVLALVVQFLSGVLLFYLSVICIFHLLFFNLCYGEISWLVRNIYRTVQHSASRTAPKAHKRFGYRAL